MEVGEEGEEDNLKGLQGSCGFLRLNNSVVVVLQCSWSVGSRSPENTKIWDFLDYLYEMAQAMYRIGPPIHRSCIHGCKLTFQLTVG